MRSWFGALLLALPTAAAGLPVFDNGVTADQLGQGDVATSDTNGGTPRQRIADDFSFDEATDVGGIQFVGGFRATRRSRRISSCGSSPTTVASPAR
jgi:hypothetical protein